MLCLGLKVFELDDVPVKLPSIRANETVTFSHLLRRSVEVDFEHKGADRLAQPDQASRRPL